MNRNEPEDAGGSGDRFVALHAKTHVVYEKGRWVVMMNVMSWEPSGDEDHPVTNNWKRINDYSTEQEAKVAALWIERSANRQIRPPMGL